jgi:serine/threonine protein kinase
MVSVRSVIAGYRIERVLGSGGMCSVYLAKNPRQPRHDAR